MNTNTLPPVIFEYARRALFWILYAIAFMPLAYVGVLYFPFITEKTLLFRALVEIAAFLFVVLYAFGRIVQPRVSFVLAAFGFLALVLAGADALGIDPHRSFWGTFERMEGLVTWLHLFAFLCIASAAFSRDAWLRFFRLTVFAAALASIYGALQLLGLVSLTQASTRVESTLGSPTFLGTYLVLTLCLSVFLWWNDRARVFAKYAYGIAILLQAVALYGTATRGALLGAVAGSVAVGALVLLRGRGAVPVRRILLGLVCVLALAATPFALRHTAFVEHSPLLSRFSQVSFQEYSSARARLFVWHTAIEGFLKRPVLGWGQENFGFVFNHTGTEEFHTQELWFDRAHSVPLDWLVVAGALGLLAYLGLFLALARAFLRTLPGDGHDERVLGAILTGGLAGYFVSNLFAFDSLSSLIVFFALAGYAHARSASSAPHNVPREPIVMPTVVRFFTVGMALLVLLAAEYVVNVRPLFAATALARAVDPYASVEDRLASLDRAIRYGQFDARGAREAFASTVIDAPAPPAALLARASREIETALATHPRSVRLRMFLAKLQEARRDRAGAIATLREAITLAPGKQFIYFELGQNYLSLGAYDSALAAYKTAFDLEPRFLEARNLYAAAALYARRDELARTLLKRYGEIPADPALIDAFAFRKNFSVVAQLWEERVRERPDDLQARFSLAASYFAAGRVSDARRELETIIERYPAAAASAQEYLRHVTGDTPGQ